MMEIGLDVPKVLTKENERCHGHEPPDGTCQTSKKRPMPRKSVSNKELEKCFQTRGGNNSNTKLHENENFVKVRSSPLDHLVRQSITSKAKAARKTIKVVT